MRLPAPNDDAQPAPAEPGRALTLVAHPDSDSQGPRRIGRRPDAGFLAQLLVSTDPALRSSRIERTRSAAAHYAATARRRA